MAGRDRALAALIALVTCLLYAQVRTHEFINFDDDVYVTANPQVQAGLTPAGTAWAFTTTLGGHWHPLTWLSLMAGIELHGQKAGRFLLTNAALHAVNASLLFLLLLSLTGRRWPSAFVAAAFALHPLRVESVAWVTERKDVQSMLFFLLALLAYVRYVRQPRPSRYLWIVCWFVLGLLTKPMLVTLPAVMLLLDVWPLGRLRFPPAPPVVLEKAPLALIALASSATTFVSQRGAGAMVDAAAIPLAARLANATWGYAVYLGQLFWPVHLAVFYPLARVPPGRAAAAALVLAAITALAWRARRRHPYVLVGWLWYLGSLVPVIGLVQVGGQARADRFTYVPHIGLLIALAWLAADGARRWPRSRAPLAACAALALFALAALSWRQIRYWRDSETLFRHALDVWPDNFLAHTNLAGALEERAQMDEAGRHYAQAVRLNPTWPEAQNNMGNVRARDGRFLEAEQHYVAALRIRPGFAEAAHNLTLARAQRAAAAPPADGAGYTRGNQYARQGRFKEAEAAYREALHSRPDWPEAHHHLGIALAAQGRPDGRGAGVRGGPTPGPRPSWRELQPGRRAGRPGPHARGGRGFPPGAAPRRRLERGGAAARVDPRHRPRSPAARRTRGRALGGEGRRAQRSERPRIDRRLRGPRRRVCGGGPLPGGGGGGAPRGGGGPRVRRCAARGGDAGAGTRPGRGSGRRRAAP